MAAHRETPIKRRNPSGKVVFVARYTGTGGKRRSAGTYKLQRDAQRAIDAAYSQPSNPETVGAYLETWLRRYPRSDRTNRTNEGRIRNVLEVIVDGRQLQDWSLSALRRRHALELVDYMLRVQGRSASGAQNVLRSLSAMCEDAITDELTGANPFRGARVRGNDQRAVKQPKELRVWTWDQMHRLAAGSGSHEPMIRSLCDCGLRVGELFALRRSGVAGSVLSVAGTAWEGQINQSSREKNHDRQIPIPPGLQTLLRQMPPRIDSDLLFPTPNGKIWRYSNFKRRIWDPACKASGIDARPHEFRHSYITHLRAAGVDPADLAAISGHSVETATARYTHPLRRSDEDVRRLVG